MTETITPIGDAAEKRRARAAASVDIAGDHANAERFLGEYGERVRYAPELDRWYVWSGSRWREDRLEQVRDLARQTIDALRPWVGEATSEVEFKKRARHYTTSCSSGRRDGLLSIARTDRSVVVGVDDLDRHPHLLACRNGTVDLRTGDLSPARPDHLITRGVDLIFTPGATSTVWTSFLSQIFADDDELIAYAQRLLGYCVTGEIGEHVMPVAQGAGANGKSTLIGVVTDVLTELAVIAPEGLLTTHREDPHPERLAVLRGRRLAVSNELEQRAVLAEQVVKSLTGGDTISAREMYGRRFDFSPTHKLLVVTNHAPKVAGTDHAIWRRLRIIPFVVTVPPEEQDHGLRQRLVAEHGEAILTWLVAGAVEWYREGLGTARAVEVATTSYRKREDVVGAFLDEMTISTVGRVQIGVVYDAWRPWAEAAGERPGRRRDFTAALEAHDITTETYHGRVFALGIGIRAGSGSADRSGQVSAGNFPNTSSHVGLSGCDLSSPVVAGQSVGPTPDDDDFERWLSEADSV